MKTFAFAVVALCSLTITHARPVIIEESAVITPPDASTYRYFGFDVGTNGEYALVLGERADEPDPFMAAFDALLYRRVNGQWVFQRILAQGSRDPGEDWSVFPAIIGMKGNLASTELGDIRATIFRFDGSDWMAVSSAGGPTEDVSIDGERILYGIGEQWNGLLVEPDPAGGYQSTPLPGQPRCCDDEYWGGPVDLWGDRVILGTPDTYDLEPQEIPIYQRYDGAGWHLRAKLQVPTGVPGLGAEVGLHLDNAIVAARNGPYVWSNFFGQPSDRLQTVGSYARNVFTGRFAKDGNLVLMGGYHPDLGTSVINVFRPDADGRYQHVAILKAKNGQGIGGSLEIDNNTVIAASNGRAYVFDLPAELTAPPPRYENFESGNGANWTASAGSSFAVVRQGMNGVFRQSSLAGTPLAVLNNSAWTHQAIEANIRPTAFEGNDRWVGLATRYANAQNFYYVTLRTSGTVDLRRMRNAAITTLASAPLAVTTNRTYRVRLESIGTAHRVYVDGRLVLRFEDPGPIVAGNAALIMYRARADYDNVIVTPAPRATIFADDFSPAVTPGDWTYTGTGQWQFASGALVQNSVGGDARALIGTPTDDQIVSARVRPIAYAAATGSQERWAGLIARYTDDRNYYYLSLRSSNTLSLRKLINGAITTIATVPFNVSVGTWYSLRLEATGNALRAYVNESLALQATDNSHPEGRAGPTTFKAAAEFDDYLSYQP
jgi:hypothetical protein